MELIRKTHPKTPLPSRPLRARYDYQPPRASASGLAIPKRARSPWVGRLQLTGIILIGSVAGLFLQVIPIGYLAVLIYFLLALIKRIPSRITFMIALGIIILSPVGIVLGQATLANVFSLMGFLLLSVGVVTLGIELLRERGSPIEQD